MQNLSCMEEATECFPVRTYVWVLYCSSCYPQLIWYLRRTYTYLDNLSCYDGNTKSPIRNMRSIKLAASVPNLKSSTADSYIVALQHTDSRGEFVDPRRKRKWKKKMKKEMVTVFLLAEYSVRYCFTPMISLPLFQPQRRHSEWMRRTATSIRWRHLAYYSNRCLKDAGSGTYSMNTLLNIWNDCCQHSQTSCDELCWPGLPVLLPTPVAS